MNQTNINYEYSQCQTCAKCHNYTTLSNSYSTVKELHNIITPNFQK